MVRDLRSTADDLGIKYFLISFTDVFGVVRSKLVPAQATDDMAKTGAGFAGFAAHMDMTPADPDMFSIPDLDSLIQLPWNGCACCEIVLIRIGFYRLMVESMLKPSPIVWLSVPMRSW